MKKMNSKFILLGATLLFTGNMLAQDFKADDILGIWFNEEKDAKIEMYKQNNKYYGKVVWLNEPNEPATGLPKLDDENDDELLRSRPVMGLVLANDFVWQGDGLYEDGDIYDPKNGSTYSCYMKFESRTQLKVRGYIGFSIIGRTTYWTRTTK
ncbi:MAG: DUF2147 domain-containing protein [Bacteroidetes bacterium]|nr:DUF2147 domain-containing protein [Bacteroidota bacterium]